MYMHMAAHRIRFQQHVYWRVRAVFAGLLDQCATCTTSYSIVGSTLNVIRICVVTVSVEEKGPIRIHGVAAVFAVSALVCGVIFMVIAIIRLRWQKIIHTESMDYSLYSDIDTSVLALERIQPIV